LTIPKDLGTIQKRLREGAAAFYGDDVAKLYRDFQLIVSNCRAFNVGADGRESLVLASALEAECNRLFAHRFPSFAQPPPLSPAQQPPRPALEAFGACAAAALAAAARGSAAAAAAATARAREEPDADESDDAWTNVVDGSARLGKAGAGVEAPIAAARRPRRNIDADGECSLCLPLHCTRIMLTI